MGAGILPCTWINGVLCFLFGKESRHEDTAPGYSDFGGGRDGNETWLQAALRESSEELTGFLGNTADMRALVTQPPGYYVLELPSSNPDHEAYRTHVFYLPYNPWLTHFYNRNQRFLQRHLPASVFRSTKIFEKAYLEWIPWTELKQRQSSFRFYYRPMIDLLLQHRPHLLRQFATRSSRATKKRKRTKQYERL